MEPKLNYPQSSKTDLFLEKMISIIGIEKMKLLNDAEHKSKYTVNELYRYWVKMECFKCFANGNTEYDVECMTVFSSTTIARHKKEYDILFPKQ